MSTKEKSTATANVLDRNGNEIDLNAYFETLQPLENGNCTAKIEVLEYHELGCLINSIISVCRSAVENENFPPDGIEVSRVLELAQNLIPLSELELLERIKPF